VGVSVKYYDGLPVSIGNPWRVFLQRERVCVENLQKVSALRIVTGCCKVRPELRSFRVESSFRFNFKKIITNRISSGYYHHVKSSNDDKNARSHTPRRYREREKLLFITRPLVRGRSSRDRRHNEPDPTVGKAIYTTTAV